MMGLLTPNTAFWWQFDDNNYSLWTKVITVEDYEDDDCLKKIDEIENW